MVTSWKKQSTEAQLLVVVLLWLMEQHWRQRPRRWLQPSTALCGHIRPTLSPAKTPHHSIELWKLARLYVPKHEYTPTAAARNYIQIPEPPRSPRNTLWSPGASLGSLQQRSPASTLVLMLPGSCCFPSTVRSWCKKNELTALYHSYCHNIEILHSW